MMKNLYWKKKSLDIYKSKIFSAYSYDKYKYINRIQCYSFESFLLKN